MNISLWLFGCEVLSLTIGPATQGDDGEDSGYTASSYAGFIAQHDMPDEIPIHHRCSPYEDDSEA